MSEVAWGIHHWHGGESSSTICGTL